MNYSECRHYLSNLGNEVLSMRPGLERVEALLDRLDRPHRRYPSVLVAGTNGKGSASRFLASMLDECGFRTGRYGSPHLVSLRERISVHGRLISRHDFARLFSEVAHRVEKDQPLTYFEMLTATAFLYFSHRQVEIAVLEIGMGGRLDATNVVDPVMTILTPISLDHQQYLGESLAQIATEKAGTIHPGRPVISSPQLSAAAQVIRECARTRQAPVSEADGSGFQIEEQVDGCFRIQDDQLDATLRMAGRHQAENAVVAVAAARELERMGWDVRPACLSKGLEKVTLEGRLQKIGSSPDVFLDGGHNPSAARAVRSFVERFTSPPRHLVFSMMRDKDVQGVAEILRPLFARQWILEMDSPRAASLDLLGRAFPAAGQAVDASDALAQARDGAATVVIFGSFYLAGEILGRMSRS